MEGIILCHEEKSHFKKNNMIFENLHKSILYDFYMIRNVVNKQISILVFYSEISIIILDSKSK